MTFPLEVQATPEDSKGREHNCVIELVDEDQNCPRLNRPIKSPWANTEVRGGFLAPDICLVCTTLIPFCHAVLPWWEGLNQRSLESFSLGLGT